MTDSIRLGRSFDLAFAVAGGTAVSNSGVAATGTATFSGQPTAGDTLTLNTRTITFRASGATGNEVNMGASLALTLTALHAFIDASTDPLLTPISCTVSATVATITYRTQTITGNSYALAKSSSVVTLSAATLTGATEAQFQYSGAVDRVIRVVAKTAAARVTIGGAAAVLIPVNWPEYFRISGVSTMTVIGDGAATGTLCVTVCV